MAQALGFVLTGASFIPLALPVEQPKVFTTVQIIAGSGSGSEAGGNKPHIALWDDDGVRIGQYRPGKNDKIKAGDDDGGPITVEHNQNGGEPADPYYVMLSNFGNDAICISAITVANSKMTGSFYGDTGYLCGQSWFLSETKLGANFYKPKCVWLDADHSNGINARAMSFHLNDLAPNTDKLTQYQENPDTLCKSTPRFSFWGNLLPDGVIPFFEPKAEYNVDSSGVGEGADKDPMSVIDKPNQYNKGVYLHQGESLERGERARRTLRPNGSNQNPEHLIVTDHAEDDVREVCESASSHGYDIASTVQKLYCDMEDKQLYQLCDGQAVTDNCFDMETKSILPKSGIGARGELDANVRQKNYTSHAHWKN